MIPIQNIYYLLCYAWNKLEEIERVSVSIEDKTTLLDLLAKVLINPTKALLKRGLDRNYTEKIQEVSAVKGKLQISQTLKQNLLLKQKTLCSFDELSFDVLHNQILFTTLKHLSKTQNLDIELKDELLFLQRKFPASINEIKLTRTLFSKVKVHRNNRLYAFLMNVCGLTYENTFPTENLKLQRYSFSDFRRDEAKMNQLFEAFVRNFYKLEQEKYPIVKKEIIKWKFEEQSEDDYLPSMETDISLENEEEKIIIDAKFYKQTMNLNFDKEKIHSTHLYQLFSYLLNQEDGTPKTQNAKGILLYPTTKEEYNLDYKYQNHAVQIRTVNLNQDWRKIEKRLKDIIG